MASSTSLGFKGANQRSKVVAMAPGREDTARARVTARPEQGIENIPQGRHTDVERPG